MKNRIKIIILNIGLSLLILFTSSYLAWAKDKITPECQRIVSISPSITDTLDSINLGNNIVGFTRYCMIPNRAFSTPMPLIIGGFLDVNFEQIIAAKPHIIFNSRGANATNTTTLRSLNFNVVTLQQDSLEDIKKSVTTIADICGVPEMGESVLTRFNQDLAQVQNKIKDFTKIAKKNVLILYGYEENNGLISAAYGAGKNFHGDILTLLGLENAYKGSLSAPLLSQESILALNPDMIFVLINGDTPTDPTIDPFALDARKISPKWTILSQTKAFQDGKIFQITGRDSVMQSVRVINLVKAMAKLIYDQSTAY